MTGGCALWDLNPRRPLYLVAEIEWCESAQDGLASQLPLD